jgi:predicted GNAT superfamily acetyltransferase
MNTTSSLAAEAQSGDASSRISPLPSPFCPSVIRDFASHADRAACVELQELTWGRGFTEKIPAAMLLVAQKTGGVTAGAFADDGTLLGFVFGVTGLRNGKLIHWSDMLAVRPEAQGMHLGERLKEYQRDQCRQRGIDTIYWTYDPLVARNAHLNLNRMGARVDEYVVAMYGDATNSPLQGDMPTDRFVITWAVDPAAAAKSLDALPDALPLAVGPDAREGALGDAPAIGVRVPRDITALAAQDLAAARRWRFATRRAFTHYLSNGYHVRGFVADATGGTYLLIK